jgi:type I restriction enzyme S subunit
LNLTQARFRQLSIPLAPRSEQGRVVAAIDEHLSRLDAAGASLSSARLRLEAFEQRLRDEASEGEPTRLGALLAEPLRNGLSAPSSPSGSIRVVTLTAVTKSEFIDAHSKLIEPGARPVDDLWMKPGDVFIQRSNTPELVGTAALYDGPDHWAIFPDLLIRVRVNETRVEPSYLELVLRSTGLRRYFQRSAQGIAGSMPKISQPIVEAAEIPLPPLDRQQSLVRRLSDDLTIAGRMFVEAERSVLRMRSLRRALLAAAFAGQLVPQDTDDEPAAVLLERIRTERAAATPIKRTRKAKAS